MPSFAEIYHLTRMRIVLFIREPEVVFWVFAFPLVILLVLGWAFKDRGPSSENVGVLMVDGARPIIETLEGVETLRVKKFDDPEEAATAVARGSVAVLVIPGETIVLRHDPARSTTEVALLRVERALLRPPSTEDAPEGADKPRLEIADVEGDVGSRYIDWLFPGLLGMNLMGTGIWSIGFAVAEMRQKKLLRRFLVTPMRRSSLLVSIGIARLIFMTLEIVILLGFAFWALDVPIRGDPLAFCVTLVLGTMAFAGIGILIASRARTIEGISGLMNLVMMPMWLFSGVFFSYEKFPESTHAMIRWLPLTALNDALRDVMLDGAGFTDVASELSIILIWGVLAFAVALKVFRWE
jgi:ABC-type multidrug transport system permease subunit